LTYFARRPIGAPCTFRTGDAGRDGRVNPRVKPEDGHDGVGDETDHHKIANKPNAPISMIKAATVIAIGRIAL
jgi:hypothetical protein